MDTKNGSHVVAEQQSPVAETEVVSEPPSTQKSRHTVPAAARAWFILFIHGACCIALALAISLALDGYKAGDKSSPRYVEGKLLLRVSDITTLVSVALVVIKIIVSVWSTIVLWAFGRHMLTSNKPASPAQVSKMIRWRLPFVLQGLKDTSRDLSNWIISVAVIAAFIQAFIGPIITGSVNWNSAIHISTNATLVNPVDPTANISMWKWYNMQGGTKRGYLRSAAGYANLAWADTSTVDKQGKSLVGNGCRHVVNNDALPQNSILVDVTIPCININGIRWYRNKDEVMENEWPIDGKKLTLVEDDPMYYFRGGITLVYDMGNLQNGPETTVKPPPAIKFSGTMTVAVMVFRRHYSEEYTDPECPKIPNTVFGDMNTLPYLVQGTMGTEADENCFLLGKIDFSAGVTKSSRATYIGSSSRVVEDMTPIQDVVYEANPWVQEAIWMLPDLLTMLSLSNVSQLSTFNNLDNYVKSLVRQGYLGAWDMLSHSFDDEKRPSNNGFRAETRLVADISFARVFAWLGVGLLMTISGVFALVVLKASDLKPPEGNNEGRTGILEQILGIFGG
ncbi:hypothetical protein B0O99DRAFT_511950 [Bisporella sp. PMI_857]|nr:hypothetical protein B0O99DRAFT_511950 [Bisporella sp. PMI_857]